MNAKGTWLFLCLLTLVWSESSGQLLQIFDADASNFPTMRAKMLALDAKLKPVSPQTGDLTLHENGTPRIISGITCPPPAPPIPLSSVLVIDVSGSMGNGLPANIELAKTAARKWVNILDFTTSECALTVFDDNGFIVQDFIRNRTAMLNAIAPLEPQNGTNYTSALLTSPAGGIPVAARGKFKRIVVFLTDGESSIDAPAAIAAAKAANVTVYAVGVRFALPADVKEIALQTGGKWFENILTESDAEKAYLSILALAQSSGFCEISWQSAAECAARRQVVIQDTLRNASSSLTYDAPFLRTARLTFSPEALNFGGITPLTTYDSLIELRADGGDLHINRIFIENPFFTILNNPAPLTLKMGQTIRLTIRFAPVDSNRTVGELLTETDACERSFGIVSGGFPGKTGGDAIRIVRPNGREKFRPSADTIIQWTGTLPDDPVTLEFSADGGNSWSEITHSATRFRYNWKVPALTSDSCLIRGRLTRAYALPADTSYDISTDVWNLRYSRSGKMLAVVGYTFQDNGSIRYFDVSRRERTPIGTLADIPTEQVSDVDISPDERMSAAFSRNTGTLVLADIATGVWEKFRLPMEMTSPGYAGVNFTPDNKFVVVGKYVFDLNQKKFTDSFPGANTGALSPDGKIMAIAGTTLMNFTDHSFICNTPQHNNPLSSPDFVSGWSADGSAIAKAAGNINDVLVSSKDCGLLARIPLTNTTTNLALNPTAEIVATVHYTDSINFWNVKTSALIRGIKKRIINGTGVAVNFTALAFSPDGKELAVGGNGRVIFIRLDSNELHRDTWRPIHRISNDKLTVEAHISPDGQQVLVLYERPRPNEAISEDNSRTAVMYDIATGSPKIAYYRVNLVSYSRSGRYILIANVPSRTADSTLHTSIDRYDARTGDFDLRYLDITGSSPTAADMYYDDSLAVIAHGNNVSLAQLAATGSAVPQIISTAPYVFLQPVRATFTASGKYIWVCENGFSQGRTFSVGWDGTLWDVGIQTTTSLPFINGDASPDGKQSAAIRSDGLATVQSLFGGAGFPVDKPVKNVRYSPDSRFVLFTHNAGFDTTFGGQSYRMGAGYVYSTNGHLLQTLIDVQMSGWMNHGTFSADSRRIATAGNLTHDTGGMTIIWEGAPEGTDQSDTLFAIVQPKAAFKDVDFGELPVGMKKDTVVTALLCNTGSFPLQVDSVLFSAPTGANFSLVSGLPVVIPPDTCISIELRFLPAQEGQFDGTATFFTSIGTVGTNIHGKGVDQSPAQANAIDFGKVVIQSFKDSLATFTIRNDGVRDITVNGTVLLGPDAPHFSIVSGGGNFTLKPNESHEMTLRFSPTEVARTSARIEFPYTVVGGSTREFRVVLPLYGEGICDENAPAIAVHPAERIILSETGNYVKVAVVSSGGMPPANSLRLRFDRTALLPVDTGVVIEGAGKTGYVTIPLYPPFANDTLTIVEFFTALGTTDSAVVIVDSIGFTGCAAPLQADSAIIVMLDICREGGVRLFDGTEGQAALLMVPNPTEGNAEITVKLIEEGITKLELTDRLGRTVLTLLDGTYPVGEHTFSAVFGEIPAGNYALIMRTPNQVFSLPVVILR